MGLAVFAINKAEIAGYSSLLDPTLKCYFRLLLFVYGMKYHFVSFLSQRFLFMLFSVSILTETSEVLKEWQRNHPVMSILRRATMPDNLEESVIPAPRVDCEVRTINSTLNVSSISVKWIVAVYKTQFPDFWDVRFFETIFLHRHKKCRNDRKGIKRDMIIDGRNRRWPTLHT